MKSVPGRHGAPQFFAMLLAAMVSGCASYQPQPLDREAPPPLNLERLTVDAARMPFPALARHVFDPTDGLDIDEVAMLAVANNPQLKVARDDLGIAQAQAFAAGLLPDPQLSLTRDVPTNGGPGNTTAFNLGLNYDVGALLTRSARSGAAQAVQRKVDLELLWQEWQVVSQARLLFVRNVMQRRLAAVLEETRALLDDRYQRALAALRQGNATVESTSADLAALQDISRQAGDLERQRLRNGLELRGLLGLGPDAPLELVGAAALPELDVAQVKRDLPQLARRRPDLLALAAGYNSQELRVREAIRAQFPALNVGVTRARDTSDLYTRGFGITLSLPIFNRNRGAIAVERATRRRLHDDYRRRLAAAMFEVNGLLQSQALLRRQYEQVRETIALLAPALDGAAAALRAGNVTELSYVGLRSALLAKRVEALTLEQQLLEQRVGMLTLAGGELPPAAEKRGAGP
ncbi:MAG: TolC family protein [Burkholderiales bacterium]